MIYLAVVLSGLGGLLAELVLVRRFGLLLGNTSGASALVIGSYLLGLGVGGLLVPTLGRRVARPLPAAGAIYALVAVTLLASDLLLRRLDPVAMGTGFLLLAVTPGVPTVLMGLAFPLVFTGLPAGPRPWQVGGLLAANLLGSLVGTAVGGNWWIPELGLSTSLALAAGAYGGAALLLAGTRAAAGVPLRVASGRGFAPPTIPPYAGAALAAALSGVLVVGLQVLLLRRLPFFLEGFQPTLSGVLAACLLGLSLGAGLGTRLLSRLGERAAPLSLALAALAINLGLQEHAVQPIARLGVATELGLHARIWLAAGVTAGPACFLLGAVVPLCLGRFPDPTVRSVVAGRLFFWQGVGSILGSLLVGHVIPAVWPHAFFVATPLVLGMGCLLLLARALRPRLVVAGLTGVLAASGLGLTGPGPLWSPEPPLAASQEGPNTPLELLDHRSDSVVTASVAYDRSRHSMVLYTNEFRATETGPFADYMKVLGHLPFLLRDHLEQVAVIAFGTGTTARSVVAWDTPETIHLVEISRAVLSLAPHFSGIGPQRHPRPPDFLRDPRARVHVTDGRRFLALQPTDSLDLVTMEPLLPYSPGTASLYTREFYELADRVLRPDGLMVQWVPTHALPADYYGTLLATFARVFPHTSVWFVDGATLLVGSERPHVPDLATLEERLRAAPEAARISLHEAGLARGIDLAVCYLGSQVLAVASAFPDLSDDRPFVERVGAWKYNGAQRFFFRRNAGLLAALAAQPGPAPLDGEAWRRPRGERVAAAMYLQEAGQLRDPAGNAREAARLLARARARLPESVLLYVEETLALRFQRAYEMLGVGEKRRGELARRQLARDAGSAVFQAARSLPTRGGGPSLAPERAAALAVAIDPLFFTSPPRYLAHLPRPDSPVSPLETLESLPEGRALAEAATGEDPMATALRAAYRVRCARALLGVLAERPLSEPEQRALAPLLDPLLLQMAVEAVEQRDGDPAHEISRLWRDDLPRPAALAAPQGPPVPARSAGSRKPGGGR